MDEVVERAGHELVRPGDEPYDRLRAVWNGMIDRRPAAIAPCATPEDVVSALRFARENDLLVAVRGGGHGVAGHAVCEGGLVIDLSPMKRVEVDAERRTVRAGGGCTLGEVDAETQRHGLATALGVVTETGIAGLTLSGGMGWLRRKHGLSCDNLVSAQVVCADGSVVTASESEHEDLFWAIRGGGGNFGVVTSFEYRLHPVGPEVFVCFVLYPASRAQEVLEACDRYLGEAGDEVSPLGVLGRTPPVPEVPAHRHGEPYVALLAVHPGDAATGEGALAPLRGLGDPIADFSGAMPYTAAQSILDEDYPDGWRYYWKSLNVARLDGEAIDRLVAHAARAPSDHSTIDVWYQGGAMGRVGDSDTAFPNRRAPYLLGVEANFEEPSGAEENVAWVREVIADMRPFSDGGVYLNFPGFMEDDEEMRREGYGANYDRLAAIKARYDPANVFRLNANVEPRAG